MARPKRSTRKPRQKLLRFDQILAATLSPTEKLVLLALCREGELQRVTAGQLADATGLHRVTVQRTLTALRAQGVLKPIGPSKWQIEWRTIQVFSNLPRANSSDLPRDQVAEIFGIDLDD